MPLAEGGAAGRTALALLAGLRGHGVRVHALAADAGPVPQARVDGVEVVRVVDPRGRLAINVGRVRRPRGELTLGPFTDAVRTAARSVDVAHLEQVEGGAFAGHVPVPDLVHLHHLVRADRDLGAPWGAGFREVLEFAAGERSAARRARWLWASSPVVRDAVHRWAPGTPVVEAPLSLLPEHYGPASLDGPPVAGLIGTLDWAPTARAVDRLLRLWPQVHGQVPQATLRIAGRGGTALAAAALPPGVEVVGEVDSATAFLRSLSVLAYPLDRGSGMKVKVLESLACGLPVVTTTCGAEGLLEDGGVLVDDDDGRLVAGLVELLRDPAARRDRGGQAREHFDRRYAPAPATAALAQAYSTMMSA